MKSTILLIFLLFSFGCNIQKEIKVKVVSERWYNLLAIPDSTKAKLGLK